jgi:hypothetical protein
MKALTETKAGQASRYILKTGNLSAPKFLSYIVKVPKIVSYQTKAGHPNPSLKLETVEKVSKVYRLQCCGSAFILVGWIRTRNWEGKNDPQT